jgi:hypothetical protein
VDRIDAQRGHDRRLLQRLPPGPVLDGHALRNLEKGLPRAVGQDALEMGGDDDTVALDLWAGRARGAVQIVADVRDGEVGLDRVERARPEVDRAGGIVAASLPAAPACDQVLDAVAEDPLDQVPYRGAEQAVHVVGREAGRDFLRRVGAHHGAGQSRDLREEPVVHEVGGLRFRLRQR